MLELISREKSQAPPPHIIWETLVDPHRPGARAWLTIERGEVAPQVVESEPPGHVVWSSIWPDRPLDRIRFVIQEGGSGSVLRWILETDGEPPDETRLGQMRYRINQLINGQMRDSFG